MELQTPRTPQTRVLRALESPTESGSGSTASSDRFLSVHRRSSGTKQPVQLLRRRTSSSSIGNSNRQEPVRRVIDEDGFDFDPLDSSSSAHEKTNMRRNNSVIVNKAEVNPENGEEPGTQKLREVGQLAAVFLEVRKGIMKELNIDVSHNEKLEQEREHNKHPHPRKIAKSTLNRAEKVKLMFNLYYLSIFQAQKATDPQYEGVDGVYNPLQIIRNRKLRKKYHQTPHISVKTLPLASSAFSKQKDRKLVWEVDVPELIYDSTWRMQHFHELINSKGDLWFPDGRKHKKQHHHHHRFRLRSNTEDGLDENNDHVQYDKLFESIDDDEDVKQPISDLEDISFQNSRNSSRSDLLDTSRPRRKKRDKIISKVRSKSPFKRPSSQLGEVQSHGEASTLERTETTTSHDRTNLDFVSHENEGRSNSQPSLKILNDIEIEHIKPSILITADTPTSTSSGDKTQHDLSNISSMEVHNLHDSSDMDDLEYEGMKALNAHIDNLRHLNSMVSFYGHDFAYKKIEYANISKFDGFDDEVNVIETDFINLKNSSLPKYEGILKGKSDELRDIQNELANDYSTRIDKMLALSDRTIGEVNTTLSLEIRKLNERFEKVKSIKNKNSQYDDLLRFGYWALENLVVLALWFIWIIYSILKVIKVAALIVLVGLKWIIT